MAFIILHKGGYCGIKAATNDYFHSRLFYRFTISCFVDKMSENGKC